MGESNFSLIPTARMVFKRHAPEIIIRKTYEWAAALATTPEEAASIRALRPKFQKLDDYDLHVLANDGEPVGVRVGISNVPESTLAALAGAELLARANRRGFWRWVITVGVTVGIAAVGWVLWFFK